MPDVASLAPLPGIPIASDMLPTLRVAPNAGTLPIAYGLTFAQLIAALADMAVGITASALNPNNNHLTFTLSNGTVLDVGPAPPGPPGPLPHITATAQGGSTPGVSVTGTAASPVLNFTLQPGPQGVQGVKGEPGPVSIVGAAKGVWNPVANTPVLGNAGAGGVANDAYVVAAAGARNIDGFTGTWGVGDVILNLGTSWVRIPSPGTAGVFNNLTLPSTDLADDGSTAGTFTLADQTGNIGMQLGPQGLKVGALTAASMTVSDDGTGSGGLIISDAQGLVGLSIGPGGVTLGGLSVPGATALSNVSVPDGKGGTLLGGSTTAGVAYIPGATVASATSAAFEFAIADAEGFIGFMVNSDGSITSTGSDTTGSGASYSADEIAQRNARALAYSAQVKSQYDAVCARPVWGYNHVISYGQSVSNGWEGWPALTTAPKYDNLMFGSSVRPLNEVSGDWVPLGSAQFSPLIAVNQTEGNNSSIVQASAAAALQPGDFTLGETQLEGGVNAFRKSQLQMRGLLADPSRRIVASSCGVGRRRHRGLEQGRQPRVLQPAA